MEGTVNHDDPALKQILQALVASLRSCVYSCLGGFASQCVKIATDFCERGECVRLPSVLLSRTAVDSVMD